MIRIALDTETYPIANGRAWPRLVCVSLAGRGQLPEGIAWPLGTDESRYEQTDEFWSLLFNWRLGIQTFDAIITNPNVELVVHNAQYDMGVLAANCRDRLGMSLLEDILDAYDEERIRCTLAREKLITNAYGKCASDSSSSPPMEWRRAGPNGKPGIVRNSLQHVMWVYHGIDLEGVKKGDQVWRNRYAELDHLPVSEWPKAARDYALEDAIYHLMAFEGQDSYAPPDIAGFPFRRSDGWLVDEADLTPYAFDLSLGAGWGRRTSETSVTKWFDVTNTAIKEAQVHADKAGFLRPAAKHAKCKGQGCSACNHTGTRRPENRKVLQERISGAYRRMGKPVPMTKPSKTFPNGQVSYAKETLIASGDPVLVAWGEASLHRTNLSKFGNPLSLGVHHAKTFSVNPMVATGRISLFNPPEHQPPKKGGYRECHEPRPGYAYVSCDWSAAEMRCWAQIQISKGWESPMAQAFRDGRCTHLTVASTLLGISYEEAARARKDTSHRLHQLVLIARQFGKIPNFGLLGGMGLNRFVNECQANGFPVDAERWVVAQLVEVDGKMVVEAMAVCDGEGQARGQATESNFLLPPGRDIIKMWKSSWMAWPYFNWIGGLGDSFAYQHWVSGMVRGNLNYTNGCNTGFQNLTGIFSRSSLRRIVRECYTKVTTGLNGSKVRGASPLYGCRHVLPLHDEHILEVPVGRIDEAGERLATIMLQEANRCHPDVPAEVEWEAMGVWSKSACLMKEGGRVVPWYPEDDPRRRGTPA